jgi:hypothetical protein
LNYWCSRVIGGEPLILPADLKEMATKAIPTLQDHARMAFELAGDMAEYHKLCKIQEYAKQVMAEK